MPNQPETLIEHLMAVLLTHGQIRAVWEVELSECQRTQIREELERVVQEYQSEGILDSGRDGDVNEHNGTAGVESDGQD